MAPGSPEKERQREHGRSPDLRECLIQALHDNKKGSYIQHLLCAPKAVQSNNQPNIPKNLGSNPLLPSDVILASHIAIK